MNKTATTQSTIGLPVERIAQLRSLAGAQGLSPAGLIENWISEAVARGDQGAIDLPGNFAWRDDDAIMVSIAHNVLPMMTAQRAMLLSAVLDGAAGTKDPRHPFELPVGRAVPVELCEGVKLAVGRHGRGVVFALTIEGREPEKFASTPSLVAEVARSIRRAVEGN